MKDHRIEFRTSKENKQRIMELAKNCNMSVGNYIEYCIFNNNGNAPAPMQKTENLLLHLGNLSDMVNTISCTKSEKSELKEEVLKLWQSLR